MALVAAVKRGTSSFHSLRHQREWKMNEGRGRGEERRRHTHGAHVEWLSTGRAWRRHVKVGFADDGDAAIHDFCAVVAM